MTAEPTLVIDARSGALSWIGRWLLALAVAAVLGLLAASCAAADVLSDANTILGSPPEDPGHRVVMIVDPGYQPLDRVMSSTEEVVKESAARGHRIRIFLVDSGNAAAMREVDLSSVNGGDLRRKSKNTPGRNREAERNTEEIVALLRTAVSEFRYDGSGADLFGAIRRVAKDPVARVVLVTGGGVHQSAGLDPLAVSDYALIPGLVYDIPSIAAPHTDLVVLGVADFSGAERTPTIEFTDGIAQLWDAACAAAWQFRNCILADDVSVLEALEG